MKNLISFLIVSVLIFSTQILNADYLILKDGTHLKGSIVNTNKDFTSIKSDGSEVQEVPTPNILKVIRKPLYLEKLKIYKSDNTVFDAYCVDYDPHSYTFLKELTDDKDIVVPASEIMYFESALNPSNISFKLSTASVSIKWESPVKSVKSYRVYFRKKGEDNLDLARETEKLQFVLENLIGGLEYEFLVRSVNDDGFESFPGRSVSFTTINQPPTRPGPISIKKSSGKDILLSWGKSQDIDGTVDYYNVYTKTGSSSKQIGKTKETKYNYSPRSLFQRHIFSIKAEDNAGLESEERFSDPYSSKYYSVRLEAAYLQPSGDLEHLFDPGKALLITATMNNYYMHGLSIGLQGGYYSFTSGKQLGVNSYDSYYAVPLMVYGGYKFGISETIYVEPSISSGFCFAGLEYKNNGISRTATAYNPIIKAGIAAVYVIDNIEFGAGLYYSSILESNARLNSMLMSLSAGYMF